MENSNVDVCRVPVLRKTALALGALLFGLLANTAGTSAAANLLPQSSGDQMSPRVISDEESSAYREAKKETDAGKRAEKLYAFAQKYPESPLMEHADFEAIEPLEQQYDAYYTARQDSDPEARAGKLIDFQKKYPQSALIAYVNQEFASMLQKSSQEKRYDRVESIAEKWLQLHPNDITMLAAAADADRNLQKYEKSAQYLEAIYALKPDAKLAREIYVCYQNTPNAAKQTDWAEQLLKMAEFNQDYLLRYSLVLQQVKNKDLAKAAEYAALTLESAELAQNPDPTALEQLQKVRRASYHVIASNLMEKAKYDEAVAAFKKALQNEKYGEGYYRIALCLENQKQIENANLYYAMTELMGGSEGAKAKTRLEALYKALHNDTLIGVDKIYKRAKEMMAE